MKINGGNGKDVIKGSALKDQISGKGGGDKLYGLGGDDILYGGTGNDKLYGGGGSDTLFSGSGLDYLYGDDGDDIFQDIVNSYAYGGIGNDVFLMNAKNTENGWHDFNSEHSSSVTSFFHNTTINPHLDSTLTLDEAIEKLATYEEVNVNIKGGEGDDILYAGKSFWEYSIYNGEFSFSGEEGDDLVIFELITRLP